MIGIYNAAAEEALRARRFLKDWRDEGYLSSAQYDILEKDTASDLRTTNVFLRLVLLFFTLVSVGAAVALFFTVFLPHPSEQTIGVFLLLFAGACYLAAELAPSQARLYRYGIEEALAIGSVGFLCAGVQFAFFGNRPYSPRPAEIECLVPAAGAAFSLWIWRRFGFFYALIAAMIFVVFLPWYFTDSPAKQHVIVALFYLIGLAAAIIVRPGHRFDYLDENFSLAEASLWLGIYLAINLRLPFFRLSPLWWMSARTLAGFSKPFYWGTWAVIWCLPPIILARGIRQKDRPVIAVGAITAVLTLISNKPYLGWTRHTWDPILLGLLLTGTAVALQRWLARGPNGIRHGFTATRLSKKDKELLSAGSAGLGLLPAQAAVPAPQATNPDFRFGGGQTGGGGAGGNY
jgi:hypothetical protein